MNLKYTLSDKLDVTGKDLIFTLTWSISDPDNNSTHEFIRNFETREDALAFIILILEASNEYSDINFDEAVDIYTKILLINKALPLQCEEAVRYFDYYPDGSVIDLSFDAHINRLLKGECSVWMGV